MFIQIFSTGLAPWTRSTLFSNALSEYQMRDPVAGQQLLEQHAELRRFEFCVDHRS